jgi:hypothetical protein
MLVPLPDRERSKPRAELSPRPKILSRFSKKFSTWLFFRGLKNLVAKRNPEILDHDGDVRQATPSSEVTGLDFLYQGI